MLKNGGDKLKRYQEKIELVKFELAGNSVIYNEKGEIVAKISYNYPSQRGEKSN